MENALSIFPINWNHKITHESTYKKEIASEINDTKELSEDILPIKEKAIDQYHQKDPIKMEDITNIRTKKVTLM